MSSVKVVGFGAVVGYLEYRPATQRLEVSLNSWLLVHVWDLECVLAQDSMPF